ncbi:hypothetical protein VNO78_16440 [Psophocarpus tetragonolobus]|uniref:Uncharacterized protein n=1 Tax=Psophocarpus tetragonolobus TaxID=3891 RepID=A0AAN9SHX7_PSOTE
MPLALWGVVGLLVLILANGMAWLGLVPVLPTFSRYCVGCAMIPFGPLHWDPGGTEIFAFINGCYLVDPASSHMLVSKIKPCMFKKLVVGPWVGSIGPPLVCTGWLVPSAGDALLALTGRVVPPDSDPIVLAFGIGVMINRDSRGHSYFIVRERKLGARRRSDTVLVSTINDADQGSADVAFRTPLAPYEKSKSLGSGGSMVARLKLKGIDGRAPPGVEPAA